MSPSSPPAATGNSYAFIMPPPLDGKTSWVHDATPILSAPFSDWAVDEVRSPTALLDGTTLRLWFAGHEINGAPPEHYGVGMLTCTR